MKPVAIRISTLSGSGSPARPIVRPPESRQPSGGIDGDSGRFQGLAVRVTPKDEETFWPGAWRLPTSLGPPWPGRWSRQLLGPNEQADRAAGVDRVCCTAPGSSSYSDAGALLAMSKLKLWLLLKDLTAGQSDPAGPPFRVRVGVTGHRTLKDEASVACRVREVLDVIAAQVCRESVTTPVVYTVVSALAEGADRLVAEVVLEREGAELEVALPLRVGEFLKDFSTPGSRSKFMELLGRAARAPYEPEHPLDRPDAYATGGYQLVDRVDVLIAVWDGEPSRGRGGTASIVEYADAQNVPRFVVSTVASRPLECPPLPTHARPGLAYRILDGLDLRPGKVLESSRLELLRESFDQFDRFGRERLGPDRFRAEQERARGYAASVADRLGFGPASADWALPSFVRSDQLANRYQWIYTRIAFAVFMFAAAAVMVAAVQYIYLRGDERVILIEVVLMVAVVAAVYFAHSRRLHARWVSYRSLAENLRSAPFIALLTSDADERELQLASGEPLERATEVKREGAVESLVPWFQRAFTEIWKQREQQSRIPHDPARLREFLLTAWIDGQITYHRKTAGRFYRYHIWLTSSINALFLGTLVAALLHAFSWIEPSAPVFLAITLPAFGAALSGYRELRQFRMHSERYRRAHQRLEHVKTRMLFETNADVIRAHALRAYSIMVDENLDWFGVLEFQDLDLVT
jgi:hypothetical protein